MYLAEKTGKLMPSEIRARYDVVQWLMFQMGNVGPMFGQSNHFRRYAPEKIQYAIDRYVNESRRLYNVMDTRLGESEYLGGNYSIADIATYPWAIGIRRDGEQLDSRPNLRRWLDAIAGRPAVEKGMAVMTDMPGPVAMDEKTRENLFGSKQFERR